MQISSRKIMVQRWFKPALALVAALAFSSAIADVPVPSVPKAVKGEQCVEETSFMRKNHMDLLMHQRDDTLREGIRTKKHSLNGCLTCHEVKENNQPVGYDNPKHFCNSCHSYAAVKIDCFDCHASVAGDDKLIGRRQ